MKGHVVAEAPNDRNATNISDRVWVSVNGRLLQAGKEELRGVLGSEMWSPGDTDLE